MVDKIGKLASLVNPGSNSTRPAAPAPERTEAEEAADEAKLTADVAKMLKLAQTLAGDDLFDIQFLIERCAYEVREDIHDSVTGEEDE